MKKINILITFLSILWVSRSNAQIYADGKNMNILNLEYIVVISGDAFKPIYVIHNNQGNLNLTDSTGQKVIFDKKNPDTIYNYFFKNGWEFLSYDSRIGQFVFKRRKE